MFLIERYVNIIANLDSIVSLPINHHGDIQKKNLMTQT